MPDWLSSMQQTFEYYVVDPVTWKDKSQIRTVTSSSITRDLSADTLGSATIDTTEIIDECYIRIYLITIQNGVSEKFPLGTYLVQTPTTKFDGKMYSISLDAYTPLIELKENSPDIGYYVAKNSNVMDYVYRLTDYHLRAPVVKTTNSKKLYSDFVANTNDTWLTFIRDLSSNAKYSFDIDELGRILFSPDRETVLLQPVWDYDDTNSSILYPDVTVDRDIYGIPNVVEVIYSKGSDYYYSKVINDDPGSPVSTVNRGREIIYRVTDPDMVGDPTEKQIDIYAENVLKSISSLEYTVTYTHGYCPVRLGDCVRLNYKRANLINVKAKVISQEIKCEPGCPVTEKAVYTVNLWG